MEDDFGGALRFSMDEYLKAAPAPGPAPVPAPVPAAAAVPHDPWSELRTMVKEGRVREDVLHNLVKLNTEPRPRVSKYSDKDPHHAEKQRQAEMWYQEKVRKTKLAA